MARNKAEEFATMDEDERNRFSGDEGRQDQAGALAFGEPRDPDRGKHYASAEEEHADPDARDGAAAELDDAAHRRAVQAERKKQGKG